MREGIRTTCPYCGVGCGVVATPSTEGLSIAGDPLHPANFGRVCSKGAALGETLDLSNRLLTPRLEGLEVSWDEALQHVADRFTEIIRAHGPEAIAFYVSGQLLTEDYYVANKLMKGFIGSANIDTNSRLCMSSAVAAHKRAFGEDIVPVQYDDLERTDLIVLVGSNTAWCHPVLFQRIVRAKEQRPEFKVVVIDPRRTPTCEAADLHLPIRAGTDVWLFNGLLAYLHQHGIEDSRFIQAHTGGAERALVVAENTAGDVAAVARQCGIASSVLEQFYGLFARTERVITAFSQGVNQSSSGTDKANSIINCHLLTGRIGRVGMGPFSLTGQPNAMGGREVGGLSNTLAAHMDLQRANHRQIVQRFWDSPVIADRPGLKAVELFDAIHAGTVKAVWVMATNPVVSLPNANKVRSALRRCEMVVVSDCIAATDTTALAHVLLPAAAWGEKDGTVTNSERCISRQRAFLPVPGAAKPDWWIVSEVAKRMGFTEAFAFNSAHEIFLEHARLSAADNHGERAFDIGVLGELTADQYNALEPVQWPLAADRARRNNRPFRDGRFFHADSRARFIATVPTVPAHTIDEEYPFVLNTGRIRDQWHTMTRTGKAPRLTAHLPEPYIDMHAQDVLVSGVRAGHLVRLSTRWGSMVARIRTSGEVPRRTIFAPIHWNSLFSSDARVGALVNPIVDPISGEPEFKHTPAQVTPFVVAWHGFILSRYPVGVKDITWWSSSQGEQFSRYELAGRRVHGDWSAWARRLLNASSLDADWLEYIDQGVGNYRAAHLIDDRLDACIFISPRPDLPSRSWLSSLFAKQVIDDRERTGLLAGGSADCTPDVGALVCSCFSVGRNSICTAIREHRLTTPQQVGQRLRAGTNCGSCLPELKALLQQERVVFDLV